MDTTSTTGYYVGPDGSPDKYRLRRMVGSGGEAQLWQAELQVAGAAEPVALKVLLLGRDNDFARLSARWSEQAELLRFARHPGVVGVREHFEGAPMHNAGTAAQDTSRQLYLVMNWVEGESLRDWAVLNQGPAATLAALRILDQVAEVLDLLHSGRVTPGGRPLVHGDLSPGNVMINRDGQAVLVDFGLVRVVQHHTQGPMGTPGFAAPETWNEGEYSPASDRYAFGALAYYLLTGAPPAGGPDQLRAGLANNPLLARRNPADIDRLLMILSPDPAQRPPSALQWVRALRNTATTTLPPDPAATRAGAAATMRATSAYTTPPPPTAPTGPAAPAPRRRRGWLVAVAVIAVLVGVIAILLATRGNGTTPQAAPSGTSTPSATTAPPATSAPSSSTPRSTAAGADPTDVPLPDGVSIRRSTGPSPITLRPSYGIDLDDDISPNWDVHSGPISSSAGGNSDVGFGSDSSSLDFVSDYAIVTGPAQYGTCAAETAYTSGSLERGSLRSGETVCVRTAENRYALITVEDSSDQAIRLDAVVWDPPVAQ